MAILIDLMFFFTCTRDTRVINYCDLINRKCKSTRTACSILTWTREINFRSNKHGNQTGEGEQAEVRPHSTVAGFEMKLSGHEKWNDPTGTDATLACTVLNV